MKIILNPDLIPTPFPINEIRETAQYLSPLKLLNPLPQFSWKPEDLEKPIFIVKTAGYINYLHTCWSKHLSATLNPTDLWYIILCELSSEIAKSPNTFAELFTTTPEEKQLVLTLTNDVTSINPESIITALKHKVPSNINTFIPKFSTNTHMSSFAMNVAFCDIVSPYYNYATFLCGIPSITINGSPSDWNLMTSNLQSLSDMFSPMSNKLSKYLIKCKETVNSIVSHSISTTPESIKFFNSIVKLQRCGSGSDKELSGWITNFLLTSKSNIDLRSIPTLISKLSWTNLETNRKFTLFSGVFYSIINCKCLTPIYNAHTIELS